MTFTILLIATAYLNQAEEDFKIFKTSVLGNNIILFKTSLVGRSQNRRRTGNVFHEDHDTTKLLAKIQNWVSNSNCVRKLLIKFSRKL